MEQKNSNIELEMSYLWWFALDTIYVRYEYVSIDMFYFWWAIKWYSWFFCAHYSYFAMHKGNFRFWTKIHCFMYIFLFINIHQLSMYFDMNSTSLDAQLWVSCSIYHGYLSIPIHWSASSSSRPAEHWSVAS